jgi:hypothetical protein
MGSTYSQLGILEAERSQVGRSIACHVTALAIRLRLRVPQVGNDLLRLAAHRAELGPGRFAELVAQTADPEDAKEIISLIDQLEAADAPCDQLPDKDVGV